MATHPLEHPDPIDLQTGTRPGIPTPKSDQFRFAAKPNDSDQNLQKKTPLDLNDPATEDPEEPDLRHASFTLEEDESEEENGPENILAGGSLLLMVMYRRDINPGHLEKAMKAAWSPMWQMTMTAIEENLFLFRFEHRIDLNKALNEGPWRFNKYLVALKEIGKDTPLEKGFLTAIPMWIQIHNVPVLKRTEKTARSFGSLFGEVLKVDIPQERHVYPFLRVQVAYRIRRAIQPHTTLLYNGTKVTIYFRYERLFNFCHWCGQLDHIVSDCVDFLAKRATLQECDMDETLGVPTPRPAARSTTQLQVPRPNPPLPMGRKHKPSHSGTFSPVRVLAASSVPTILTVRSNLLVPPGFEKVKLPLPTSTTNGNGKMSTKTYRSKRFRPQSDSETDIISEKLSETLAITVTENDDPNLEFGKRTREEDMVEMEQQNEGDTNPSKMLN